GHIRIGGCARLEKNLNDAHAGQRARLNVVYSTAQGKKSFKATGDLGLDLLRRHAVIESGYYDLRDVDGRKEIDWHARQTRHAYYQDQQANYDDQVRVADREPRHQFAP